MSLTLSGSIISCFCSGFSAQWWLHELHHAIEKESAKTLSTTRHRLEIFLCNQTFQTKTKQKHLEKEKIDQALQF